MNLAIVGTAQISHQFTKAAIKAGFSPIAVLSRDSSRGREFLDNYDNNSDIKGMVYTDMNELVKNPDIDVVYIASPNIFHFSQTMICIEAHKHVLIEKPCFSNSVQLQQVLELAEKKGVFVLETLRLFYNPAINAVRESLSKIEPIRHVAFNYMRYSSKYDEYRAGQPNSSFSKEFGGGALPDLGVYVVYACIDLFGFPDTVSSHSVSFPDTNDITTTLILGYKEFNATLTVSKVAAAYCPSEIVGEKGVILIENDFLRGNVYVNTKEGKEMVFDATGVDDMYVQQVALLSILKGELNSSAHIRAKKFMVESTKVLEVGLRKLL
ncbi:MAG: Gfo/Idh/MocA family oxidoreductase [Defluviitaleaceae bacterium]|nr:Gfo/Idh/MocA family oxidoreductase [Defluviitaleaceae bacterium]